MIISILYGGATASQLDYIYKELKLSLSRNGESEIDVLEQLTNNDTNDEIDSGNNDILNTTQTEYWNSRSEAKKAHQERLEAQRNV